jgi:hypothetical protein
MIIFKDASTDKVNGVAFSGTPIPPGFRTYDRSAEFVNRLGWLDFCNSEGIPFDMQNLAYGIYLVEAGVNMPCR